MSPAGLYHPGASVLHRLPAGLKLAGLAAGVTGLLLLDQLWWLGAAAVVVAALHAVARVPARLALAQVRPLLWFGAFLLGAQLLLTDWQRALSVVLTLVLSVALAGLVTLTTRVSAMLDVAETLLGPLRRVGVRPDRVGLVLALTIRGVPVIAGIAGTVREAHHARGSVGRPWALLVPVLVRVLRHADALGDALAARGADDEPGSRHGTSSDRP
ncbi:MAG: energy-coupling factor transporter transmembrane protein EcfT [Geodermatophilaceae bacterium]|nr:energy-coupling factor transporter transmembrane protein EcfT [Geodermatophilaceae bacterium]